MKVYLTETVVYDGASHPPEAELEVPTEVGEDLIDQGLAAKQKRTAAKKADEKQGDDDES